MLSLIDYDLHVLPEIYDRYAIDLCSKNGEVGILSFKKKLDGGIKNMASLTQISSQASIKTIPSDAEICTEEASQ